MTTGTLRIAATGSRFAAFAEIVAVRVAALVKAFRHRSDLTMLGRFDDRMLADIGLTRGDLRDAAAEPIWRDGTQLLVKRARERRTVAGRAHRVVAPSIAPSGLRLSRYY